jgi:hypothetical protein
MTTEERNRLLSRLESVAPTGTLILLGPKQRGDIRIDPLPGHSLVAANLHWAAQSLGYSIECYSTQVQGEIRVEVTGELEASK